jgi:hypothetical protein
MAARRSPQRVEMADIPDVVVAEYFGLDGPYEDERTIAAARTIAELVRYLARATRRTEAVRWPSTVDSVLGALSEAEYGKRQLYRQLAELLHEACTGPAAYLAQPVRGVTSPRMAALSAGVDLDEAGRVAAQQDVALNVAREYTTWLGVEDGEL